MKILNKILNFILIIINIILYIISAFTFDKKYFILYTIIIILILLWSIYKKLKRLNSSNNKKSNLLWGGPLTFNSISLVIILIFSYSVITYKGDLFTDFLEMGLLLEIEKDNYYDEMNEKDYKNIRIIYNKDSEATIPLIERYIDEINEKGEKILKDMLLSCKDKDFKTIINDYMNCSLEEFENNLELDIKECKFEDIVEDNDGDTYINTKIKCLEDYIKYDENNIGAYEILGNFYEHIGESELAKENFDKAKLLKN